MINGDKPVTTYTLVLPFSVGRTSVLVKTENNCQVLPYGIIDSSLALIDGARKVLADFLPSGVGSLDSFFDFDQIGDELPGSGSYNSKPLPIHGPGYTLSGRFNVYIAGADEETVTSKLSGFSDFSFVPLYDLLHSGGVLEVPLPFPRNTSKPKWQSSPRLYTLGVMTLETLIDINQAFARLQGLHIPKDKRKMSSENMFYGAMKYLGRSDRSLEPKLEEPKPETREELLAQLRSKQEQEAEALQHSLETLNGSAAVKSKD